MTNVNTEGATGKRRLDQIVLILRPTAIKSSLKSTSVILTKECYNKMGTSKLTNALSTYTALTQGHFGQQSV